MLEKAESIKEVTVVWDTVAWVWDTMVCIKAVKSITKNMAVKPESIEEAIVT
jgi:hypothetical protein